MHISAQDSAYKAIAAAIGYTGRKDMSVREAATIELQGTYWSDGSRSSYVGLDISRYPRVAAAALPQYDPPQFGGPTTVPVVKLHPGLAVVELSIFMGKTMGPHLTVHPDNFAAMLPPADTDLTRDEAIVLLATNGLKSSYRRQEAAQHEVDASRYDAALDNLIATGLLRKNKAITAEGKNHLAAYRRTATDFPRYL